MGTMRIKITGTGMAFTWEGDDDAIRNVMEATQRMAAAGDSTPETYAQSVLKNLPALAKEKDEIVQQHVMMAILYLVLMVPADKSGRLAVLVIMPQTRTSTP
jgi:hypothetical protein